MSTKGHGQSSGRQTYLDWIGERSHDRGKKLWLNNAISRKSNSQSGEKDLRVQFPTVTAEVKLSVTPERAAVFVDGVFAGRVAEFGGVSRALLVAPGRRKITISLTGYQTFETEVTLVANQKFKIQTDLTKGGVPTTPVPDQE